MVAMVISELKSVPGLKTFLENWSRANTGKLQHCTVKTFPVPGLIVGTINED